MDKEEAGIKIAGRNINNLRYADDTTLMAKSKEKTKSLVMKVKVKKRLKTLEKCVIMIFRDVIKFLAPCTKARGQRPKGGNKHEQV